MSLNTVCVAHRIRQPGFTNKKFLFALVPAGSEPDFCPFLRRGSNSDHFQLFPEQPEISLDGAIKGVLSVSGFCSSNRRDKGLVRHGQGALIGLHYGQCGAAPLEKTKDIKYTAPEMSIEPSLLASPQSVQLT